MTKVQRVCLLRRTANPRLPLVPHVPLSHLARMRACNQRESVFIRTLTQRRKRHLASHLARMRPCKQQESMFTRTLTQRRKRHLASHLARMRPCKQQESMFTRTLTRRRKRHPVSVRLRGWSRKAMRLRMCKSLPRATLDPVRQIAESSHQANNQLANHGTRPRVVW